MAKLCALIVLAAFAVVARGIRIDPPKLTRIGKYFAHDADPRITVDDPICRHGNGLYPHPSDCTKYLACRDGASQMRTCPEGFKFDSRRHCTPDVDADCGKPRATKVKIPSSSVVSAELVECPENYGYFPDLEDCHKFLVCVDAVPTIHTCPEGSIYHDNIGCMEGTVCPKKAESEAMTCPEQYGQFPYPGDCHKYITCDDWNPTLRMCNEEQGYEGCWDRVVCPDSEPQQARVSAGLVECPENYGYFPYLEDCHKFLVCVDGVPTIHTCPEGSIYQDNIGCMEGSVCPKKAESEDSQVTCRKANALYPHERCDWYYKCVASRPHIKECTKGTAFDPKKAKCTKAMFNKCMKKNDLQDIMRA